MPALAGNTEASKKKWGVEALVCFGQQAEPALPLIIRILEDESEEWRYCHEHAIQAIRAMGSKGKPAADALLKLIASSSSYRQAAVAYLDIGGDPVSLFPSMGGSWPVLAKIDPEKLVKIPGFQEYLRSSIPANCRYDILNWLGPHAEFLLPELKGLFQQQSSNGYFDRLLDVVAQFGPARQELVPLCVDQLKQQTKVPHVCLRALRALSRIGDDQRLAYETIKELTQSTDKNVQSAAKACLQSLYGD